MKYISKIWPIIFILIFSLFSFTPFFVKGFFPIHDNTQVARVFEMGKGLRDGMIPVRWSADLGYGFGYPIFNYYDPLAYYIGGAINAVGVDALTATKFMMIGVLLLSALSMYFLAKEFWGSWGGILSSLLYVYAPYHAVDIYVRGDFAECLAYSLIPFIFYGIYKTFKDLKWQYVLITALSFAGVILSHNLTALMVTPFILIFSIYLFFIRSENRYKTFGLITFGLLSGILLSAFYSVPAIFEMKLSNVLSQVGGGADFRDHYVCLKQLWASPWGYGGSVKGCVDGLSFMIGKYHIIISAVIVIFSLFQIIKWKKSDLTTENKNKFWILILFSLFFLCSLILMLNISKPFWEIVKPMSFIQYPWRFLIFAVFFSSFISGSVFWFIRKKVADNFINYVLGIGLAFFIIFVSVKFFVPQVILDKSSNNYTELKILKWDTSKISDEYMPPKFQKPKSESQVENLDSLKSKDLKISDVNQKTQKLSFKYESLNDSVLVVPIAYFPAWTAYVDGEKTETKENKKGTLIDIKKGKHFLEFKYVQTPIELAGNLLSVTGIVILIAGIIEFRKKYE